VPAFERLFEQQGRSFARLHLRVQQLAAMPQAERRAVLESSP
jgi:predicted aminopeptidase